MKEFSRDEKDLLEKEAAGVLVKGGAGLDPTLAEVRSAVATDLSAARSHVEATLHGTTGD